MPGEQMPTGVETWLPLVWRIAEKLKRKLPPSVDVEDLVQYGVFGLAGALRSFDEARGIKFETFSAQRIRGAMLDGLRDEDWVPRLARERGEATVLVQSIDEPMCESDTRTFNLADVVVDESGELPDVGLSRNEVIERLLGTLDPDDAELIRLRYLEERTMADIGKYLQVSESRISQRISAVMRVLQVRSKMLEDGTLPTEPVAVQTETATFPADADRRPFICDQLPGRRFNAKEAAEEADVTRASVYNGVNKGYPIGPRQLRFRRDRGASIVSRPTCLGRQVRVTRRPQIPLGNLDAIREQIESRLKDELAVAKSDYDCAVSDIKAKYQRYFDAFKTVGDCVAEIAA